MKKPLRASVHEVLDGQRRVEHRELDLNRAAIGVEVHLRRHRRSDRGAAPRRSRAAAASAPAGSAAPTSLARIELLQQRRGADADRPVLVGQRRRQHRLRRGGAVLGERAERRRARDIRRVALAQLVRRGQRRRAVRRLQLAETRGRGGADHRIVGLQALEQHRRRRSGRASLTSAASTAGITR